MFKRICALLFVFLYIPVMTAYADAPYISAYSAVVLDADSKSILYDKNSSNPMPMASTTKVMTCLLACESGRLDEMVTITQQMLDKTEGSMIYIAPGDKITLRDLVNGALLASGNDAANSIAVFLSGSVRAFAAEMNKKAKLIGMENTLFVTPSGLDDGNHHSTAYDMALLSCEAIKNPIFAEICRKQKEDIYINGKAQTVYNHNKLLYNEGFVGVKTGYTQRSGRCLISAYEYLNNTIIIVTMNAPDDWNDHKGLAKYAENQYNTQSKAEHFSIDVVGARQNKVRCEAEYSLTCIGDVSTRAYYYPFVYAPAKAGNKVGYVDVYCGENKKMTVDIIVRENVKIWQTTK